MAYSHSEKMRSLWATPAFRSSVAKGSGYPVSTTPWQYILDRIALEDRGFGSPCWIWQKSLNEKGYARARIPVLGRDYIHRHTYRLSGREIPSGHHIDHLCRVTSCVNPDHLDVVTPQENSLRTTGLRPKGNGSPPVGTATVCSKGHARIVGQACKQCRAAYMREWVKRPGNAESISAAKRARRARARA